MASYNGNYNNNTRERKSTNTSGIQFFNSEGVHKSTLKYDFWDKYISIKLHPALPADKMTANEKFDYDQSIISALSGKKALKLAKYLTDIIEGDLIAKGEKYCKGVPIGTNNGIFVGVAVPNEGSPYGYLLVTRNIDPETKKPEVAMYYQFTDEMGVDYDIETGNFDTEQDQLIEMELLRDALKADAITLIGATAHAARHIDKYYRDSIANAVGATKGGASNGHSYNSANVFGGGTSSSSASNSSAPADRESMENFSDIEKFSNM